VADIFISYKKEDSLLAERVVTALRDEGMSVWWDDGITPQEAWDRTIEQELSAASTVVVLWTPLSVSSEWVRREAHYGQDRGKLVPVLVESCTVPIAFSLNQTVNLVNWNGDRADRQWRKLLTWVTDLATTKPGNANIPQAISPAQPNRFRSALGHLASGDPIYEGAFVNTSTPAGTAFIDGEGMPVMRILPMGSFLLGSTPDDPDRATHEGPQKRIEIPAAFAIGVFPVLVSEYRKLVESPSPAPIAPAPSRGWFGRHKENELQVSSQTPAPMKPGVPITQVTFDEAAAFASRLSSLAKESYRIPSEAEWEYACRAGTRTRYSCGDTIDSTKAAFGLAEGPIEAGKFAPNAFGIYDLHGNVREWTADLWHDSYDTTPLDGRPATEGHGSMRIVRGGGWSDDAVRLRSAARMRATESIRASVIGFRVARSLA
jgi:formylglycine-generating enzyme required for sulfatase activity